MTVAVSRTYHPWSQRSASAATLRRAKVPETIDRKKSRRNLDDFSSPFSSPSVSVIPMALFVSGTLALQVLQRSPAQCCARDDMHGRRPRSLRSSGGSRRVAEALHRRRFLWVLMWHSPAHPSSRRVSPSPRRTPSSIGSSIPPDNDPIQVPGYESWHPPAGLSTLQTRRSSRCATLRS